MKFAVSDKVAYSVQFLKSIGMSHSDMAHARGVIKSLKTLSKEITLAEIEWKGNVDLPSKVNVVNLAKVGANSKFCSC